MLKQISTHVIALIAVVTVFTSLSGCAPTSRIDALSQTINQGSPTKPTPDIANDIMLAIADEIQISSLQEFLKADLIIEGRIVGTQTHWVTDTTATNAELADRQARGLPIGTYVFGYQVAVDKVLNGQAPSATIVVAPAIVTYEIGDRVILFLRDISGDPIQALGQTKYAVMTSAGQFRIEKDSTLFSFKEKGVNPLVDTYRGIGKDVLEKDIQNLIAQLPKPNKLDVLRQTLKSTGIVIEGTIQSVQAVHFVNSAEKSQQEIDQLLAEGKIVGLVLTDYVVTVNKVLYDMRGDNPKYFPDWKPLQPGQTIIVTRQGGTYRGVTQIAEAGSAFVIGDQEVLFLSNFSLTNYDVPDDGQVRYSTNSQTGRFLIGSDKNLKAFSARGLGEFYARQGLDQLEQDIDKLPK